MNNPSSSRSSSRRVVVEPLQPAIWASRHVEWPLASKLPGSTYAKLLKSCRVSGQQIGVLPRSSGGGVGSGPRIGPINKTIPLQTADDAIATSKGGKTDVGTAESSSSNYFTDLMSRISSANPAAIGSQSSSSTQQQQQQLLLEELSAAETRALSHQDAVQLMRPPRSVFVANGWIVAALECPIVSSASSSSYSFSHPLSSSLRLISRWNVRRGVASNLLDGLVALPPPVCGSHPSLLGTPIDYRVAHIFVDPTGSHILISSYNGEAYYIHSNNSSRVIKLAGFGYAADGTWAVHPPNGGIPATATIHTNVTSTSSAAVTGSASTASPANTIQTGITVHSYVTAVAWDKEKGTEGNTQTILLGTSIGEIYEYKLVEESMAKGGENVPPPILLHRLDAGGEAGGGRVSGLQFERLRTGVLVLAATSGNQKRTRLYTFYSPHSSSFRYVLSDSVANLQELPGSVDWAHLCLCSDHFAMRTRTGIYYGTIDRSLSGPAILSGGSSMMVSDSGLLHYSDNNENETNVPVSLALTPHHIVTLSENNELKFINRVAQKVIQTERIVDDARTVSMISSSGGGSLTAAHLDEIQHGELLMDIRRPDQIWLRKGRSLVHISSSQEDRDVWKFTLQKCLAPRLSSGASRPSTPAAISENKRRHHKSSSWSSPRFATVLTEEEKAQEALFEQAKTLCTNASQKAVVTAVRAEYNLQHGRGELAAKYFAQCPPNLEPFADTAIRLALPKLGIDDITTGKARECLEASNLPLITYLSDKMRMGSSNDDKMSCTMIGAWLTELFLNERGDQLTSADDLKGVRSEVETSHRALLAQFLGSNVNTMDAKTIIKILTSHDVGAAECASYAAKSGDIATAVNAALSAGIHDSVCFFFSVIFYRGSTMRITFHLTDVHFSLLFRVAPIMHYAF